MLNWIKNLLGIKSKEAIKPITINQGQSLEDLLKVYRTQVTKNQINATHIQQPKFPSIKEQEAKINKPIKIQDEDNGFIEEAITGAIVGSLISDVISSDSSSNDSSSNSDSSSDWSGGGGDFSGGGASGDW